MHLTKYQIIPLAGGWGIISSIGKTRFEGQVLSWNKASEVKERLTARQSRVYARLARSLGVDHAPA